MPKYSKAAAKSVEKAVHEEKRGELKSGPKGKGGKVKSRKQAIAIGLSEARKNGAKVPTKKPASKSTGAKTKVAAAKSTVKKTASKKGAAKKATPKKPSKKVS